MKIIEIVTWKWSW